jgi:hypothetical protein
MGSNSDGIINNCKFPFVSTRYAKSKAEMVVFLLLMLDVLGQALNYPLKSMIFFRALLLALTHLWAQFSPEQP